jgi:predicted nucleic acid-binding protein
MANSQAIAPYRLLRRDPRVGWLGEPEGLEADWFALASLRTPAPKRWMEAYLCAFARSVGADLVTFDRGYLQFEGDALKITLLA